MATDEVLRRAIIDTTLGKPVESQDPKVRRVVEQVQAILDAGGTVDIPPEIEATGDDPEPEP